MHMQMRRRGTKSVDPLLPLMMGRLGGAGLREWGKELKAGPRIEVVALEGSQGKSQV